jgi:NAD(P)-dependent dehydrogenase (short-subunit alcohol dehydrogenase family)
MNSYVLPSAASLACWRHTHSLCGSSTAQGIGAAVGIRFAQAGANVYIIGSCSFLPMMYTLAPAWAKRIPTAAPMPWAVDDPQNANIGLDLSGKTAAVSGGS